MVFVGIAATPPDGGLAARAEPSPRIVVWTDAGSDPITRGATMTVRYRTDVDGYVTIMRVDTDGRLRVLFPRRPDDDNFARGGIEHRVPGRGEDYTLRVEEYPGEGFLFALVTLDPLEFPRLESGVDFDYAALGVPARITSDPYAIYAGMLAALLPEGYLGYAQDAVPYFVEDQHGYPRFVCYQCHAYVSPAVWDPYAHTCIRWRVVDAGWPYPFANLPGSDVVIAAPLPPRFVVEPRKPGDVAPAGPTARAPRGADGRRPSTATAPAPPRRIPVPAARPGTAPSPTSPKAGPTSRRHAAPSAGRANPTTAKKSPSTSGRRASSPPSRARKHNQNAAKH